MAKHLHTAVSEQIARDAFDAENAAERRAESQEYADEVRGKFDHDGPEDFDDRGDYEDERDEDHSDDGEDSDVAQGHYDDDGPEDLGWDGGMEE